MSTTIKFIAISIGFFWILLIPSFSLANLGLAKQKNCLACHAQSNKLIGPSFDQIAQKYAGQSGIEQQLASRIISGGKGSFGSVPMPPSPGVSSAEAAQLAHWILTGESSIIASSSSSRASTSASQETNVVALLQEAIAARNEIKSSNNNRQPLPQVQSSRQVAAAPTTSSSGGNYAGSVVLACLQHREAPSKPGNEFDVGETFTNVCNEPIHARWCDAETHDKCNYAGPYGYRLLPGESKTLHRNSKKTVGFIFWACKLSEGGRNIRMDYENRCVFE